MRIFLLLLSCALGAVTYLAVYAPVNARRRPGMAGLGFLPALGVALVIRNVAEKIDPRGSQGVRPLFAGGRTHLFA